MRLYQKVIEKIRKECPYFTMKFIINGLKARSLEEIEKSLRVTMEIAAKFQNIIVGYDLVMVIFPFY